MYVRYTVTPWQENMFSDADPFADSDDGEEDSVGVVHSVSKVLWIKKTIGMRHKLAPAQNTRQIGGSMLTDQGQS
jgi:hypothetical protein